MSNHLVITIGRSISENVTWGQRKRFADGKVTVPFKRFLGYDRGEDGNLVINEEQAATAEAGTARRCGIPTANTVGWSGSATTNLTAAKNAALPIWMRKPSRRFS